MTGDHTQKQDSVPLWRSCRGLFTLVAFLGTVNVYALRMDMSVGIICMTNHTEVALRRQKNLTDPAALLSTEVPVLLPGTTGLPRQDEDKQTQCDLPVTGNGSSAQDGPYPWDSKDRNVVLGAFFYGYLVSQIPAGILVQKVGSKVPLLVCSIVNALTTLIVPVASASYGVLIGLRAISGLVSGFWFPCLFQMWSYWAPPMERSKLMGFCNAGVHIGNAVTLPIAGLLCKYGFAGGWPSIFYVFGVAALLWCILWAFFVYDGPSNHPRIAESEKTFIVDSLKGQVEAHEQNVSLPLLSFLKCLPLWAILVVNVCFDWNGYLFLTNVPSYMKDVLKVDISSNGFLSALPYIGFWAGQMGAAFLADLLTKHNYLSVTWIRKLMTSIGMFGPMITLLALAHIDCTQPVAAVALLTLALTLKSGSFLGALMNHVDIAPKYAGILFAITNSIAAVTGFAAPSAVGAITYNNLPSQWQTVFYISAAVYAVGGVFYLIFGSAELQSWASNAVVEKDLEVGEQEEMVALKSAPNDKLNGQAVDEKVENPQLALNV